MSEIEIIKETPISLPEVRAILEKIEKKLKEPAERIVKTKEYIDKVTKKTEKDAKEIKTKLEKAEIARLREKHIAKIIDIWPKDPDSVKTLFAGEPITLKQEDIKKIIECLK